jgi:predicted transcriptional regulator
MYRIFWHPRSMSTKELAMETIRDLPENTSWQQIEDRIHFLAAIETARDEVRRGEVIPHDEIRNLLSEWTSK